MLLTVGERKSMALLCMALADLGVEAVSFTGSQVGIITDTAHGQGQDPRGQGRPRPRGARRRARCASSPASRACPPSGRSPRSAGAGPTPRRSPWRPRSRPTRCEIYTDVTGVFSADPRIVPQARKLARAQLRRDARDGGQRRAGAGAAVGRVRPQPRRAPARALELHLGAGHLGHRGGANDGRSDHLRRHPRRRPRRRSRSPACPTGPASRPRCSSRWPTPASTST